MNIGAIPSYSNAFRNVSINRSNVKSITFGSASKGRRSEDEDKFENSKKAENEGSKKAEKHILGRFLQSLFCTAACTIGVWGLMKDGARYINRQEAIKNFREDPTGIAQDFVDNFQLDEISTSKDGAHTELSFVGCDTEPFSFMPKTKENMSPAEYYSYIGAKVALIFDNDTLSAATLDLDNDKIPEITVKLDGEGNLKILYDINSDGKIDFAPSEEDDSLI